MSANDKILGKVAREFGELAKPAITEFAAGVRQLTFSPSTEKAFSTRFTYVPKVRPRERGRPDE